MLRILRLMQMLSAYAVLDMTNPCHSLADVIPSGSIMAFGNFYLVIGICLILINLLLAFIKLHKIKMSMPPDGSDAENHNVRPSESGHSKEK